MLRGSGQAVFPGTPVEGGLIAEHRVPGATAQGPDAATASAGTGRPRIRQAVAEQAGTSRAEQAVSTRVAALDADAVPVRWYLGGAEAGPAETGLDPGAEPDPLTEFDPLTEPNAEAVLAGTEPTAAGPFQPTARPDLLVPQEGPIRHPNPLWRTLAWHCSRVVLEYLAWSRARTRPDQRPVQKNQVMPPQVVTIPAVAIQTAPTPAVTIQMKPSRAVETQTPRQVRPPRQGARLRS